MCQSRENVSIFLEKECNKMYAGNSSQNAFRIKYNRYKNMRERTFRRHRNQKKSINGIKQEFKSVSFVSSFPSSFLKHNYNRQARSSLRSYRSLCVEEDGS